MSQQNLHPAEAAARQRAILLRVIRVAFLILIVTFTMLAFLQIVSDQYASDLAGEWWIPVLIASVLFGSALAVDLLVPNKRISTIIGILVGVIAGLLATLALGFLIDLLLQSWVPESEALKALKPVVSFIKILIGITFCYLGVTTVLQTQDDFRLVIPYVEFSKQLRGVRPMLLDSSALIDGRVVDVAASGFLQAPMLVPRFVVQELQTLADSADGLKRAKGRRGLDVISRLQRSPRLDVTIDETQVPGVAVDQMLVELARGMPAVIVTTDLALTRVAAIHNVGVLNLHDLANAMKSALVPGEQATVRLMRQGEQAGQAVGYLPDGTMIVAEDGAPHIGETVTLTVTSSLQTSGGRLIFARLRKPDQPDESAAAPTDAPISISDPAAPNGASSAEPHNADAAEDANHADTPADLRRGPFPPIRPKTLKTGSPRNPRR